MRRRGLDPIEDRAAMRRLVDEVVSDYDERALTSSLPPLSDARSAARAVYDAVAGFGPLQRHLDDPTVEEIWINEPGRVFVIDIDPGEALGRQGRSDRIGSESVDFQMEVSAAYRDFAVAEPWRVVLLDGSESVEELVDRIMMELGG